jgi:putative DNA primase/helicase
LTPWDKIPAELRDRPQWVVWRLEKRDGKATKAPYVARPPLNRGAATGTRKRWRASTTDPSTWRTCLEAVEIAKDDCWDGIGYVFSADDGYVGVDLDDGLSESDRGAIIGTLDSYAEFSVSGKGVHVIVRASLNGHRRNRSGPFEVYEHGRYFCMTGQHVRGTPTTIEERQAELDRVLAHFLPARDEVATSSEAFVATRAVDLDDRELLDRAMAARNGADFVRLWNGDSQGYPSRSEADLALCSHLAFWAGNDPARIDRLYRASGLYRDKWERADYRESTVQKSLSAEVYKPSESSRPDRDAVGTHPAAERTRGQKSAESVPVFSDFSGESERNGLADSALTESAVVSPIPTVAIGMPERTQAPSPFPIPRGRSRFRFRSSSRVTGRRLNRFLRTSMGGRPWLASRSCCSALSAATARRRSSSIWRCTSPPASTIRRSRCRVRCRS